MPKSFAVQFTVAPKRTSSIPFEINPEPRFVFVSFALPECCASEDRTITWYFEIQLNLNG